jgi:hypothetical protein
VPPANFTKHNPAVKRIMTEKAKFVDDMTASIATWHGVAPPNDVALRMLGDLEKLIGDFEALRGTLRFEDEPSSFEAALREAATIGVRS